MHQDMTAFLDERGHVPASEMARFVDGDSEREAKSLVTRHLADCEECREELTAVRRLVPRRSLGLTRLGTTFGVAATLAVAAMSWRGLGTSHAPVVSQDSMRAPQAISETDATIAAIAPLPNADVPRDRVRLVWHAAGSDAAYRVVVQDESGGVVLSAATEDSVIAVPSRAFANATVNGRYYWSVEARLLDGRAATASAQSFRVH